MTSFAVLGDRNAGKTVFMHHATHRRVPLNIFTLTRTAHFQWQGALHSSADFSVLPGACTNEALARALHGVDGLIVLYKQDIGTARQWLCRAAQCVQGVHAVPSLVVCTGAAHSDVNLTELLRAFPCAQHAYVQSAVGAQDCVNRIVTRARRYPPSPLEMHATMQ